MKNYHIHREGKAAREMGKVTVIVSNKQSDSATNYELTPGESQRVRNHSPDGFEFGYGGSGPSQLALAILLDFTGKTPHPELYQDFKWKFLARMHHPGAEIPGWRILEYIDHFKGNKFIPHVPIS